MKKIKQNELRVITLSLMILLSLPMVGQNPSDLMRNCNGWKITYPTGEEDKTLCGESNNEFFFVNASNDAIVFRAPVRNDNGTTPNSDYIRSELREREEDGSSDIYWTTEGSHMLYVEQAITHLPIEKPHLVATQIHGNKADGIDDSMVMRLEDSHLFISFNGGKLRDDVTIKTDYNLGDKHEVIFHVLDGKHYCYYSEDGNLLEAFNNGTADAYLVKADGNDYVMDLNYDQTYFKVGNYTQSNPEREGDSTDDPDNYGEVLVYDFTVQHGDAVPENIAVTGLGFDTNSMDVALGSTEQLAPAISPSNATNKNITYTSSNTSIVSVNSSGVVTALSEGTSVITATTQEGGFADSINIQVNAPSAGDDIALNKLVYSTGSADGSNIDSNLVDGDFSTRWSVSGFPQEAIIDLGADFTIGSTELVCYSDRAYQYEISVSDAQNGTYATIVDRSSNSTPGTEASPIKDVFSSVSTRFVKIRVTGAATYEGTWVSLLDFKIFSERDQEPPVEVAAPYDIPKFQSYLELCKLQSPLSNTEATASSIMNGYSSASFFVADSDKIAFSQTRDANATKVRSELRYENNWLVENQNRSLHANLDVKIQTCEQLTLLQIHDDANAGNGPNKPLLRVYSLNGGLFAAVKTDSEGVATTHIPMGSLPSGYFDCDISLEDERLLVSVNGSEFVNRDISYWSFPSYWKNGAYLQDAGEALVYFNELSETVSSVVVEPEKSNVALNKSAVASEQQSENPASNLIDGDADSRWSAQYFPQSVVVDLGGVYTISGTEVICFNDRAYQFIIEASTDNNNYSLIVDRSDNTTSGSNDNPISDAFSNIDARYVRVSVTGANGYSGSWVSLEELRVMGYSTLSSKEADQKLALKAEEAKDEVAIWPNPAQNSIHISGYENLHTIRIYNQLGSLVIDEEVSSETIDISQLATGTYTVILVSDTETISKRIVKL